MVPIKRDGMGNDLLLTVVQCLKFYWSFFRVLNISLVYAVPKITTKAPSRADGHFLVCSKLLKGKKKEEKKRTIKHNETLPMKGQQLFLLAI